MAQAGRRKCLCRGDFFDPDHRNRERQRYCAATGCRRASHAVSQAVSHAVSQAVSQAAWLAKSQNQN